MILIMEQSLKERTHNMETTKEKHAHTPGPWELVQERDYLNIQETKTNLIVAQFCSVSEANA